MKFYLAPLEGLTGYIYRNAYAEFFGEIDKYFTPFIASNQHGKFSTRELHDVLPAHNTDKYVVPQILTNNAEDFIRTTKQLQEMGYNEVNLNLGCPSGTVVTKGKGSGFLAYPEALAHFLDQIYEACTCKISVKTRIGKEVPEEFEGLLTLFNQYPMEELIIHPRVQKDYYKNTPNKVVFKDAIEKSKNPLCYNGDIFTTTHYETLTAQFANVDAMMLGRGIIANPGLVLAIKQGKTLDKQVLRAFHEKLYMDYQEILSGERNVLFKMKEMWFYMACLFEDADKGIKKIKKSQRLSDYEQAVEHLFETCTLRPEAGLFSK